ncbi:ABC transporter C family member 14 [Zea mays]|uniref:ABC transporter C family member 4 n=3 Tax=Zea mays TaxID=4577 RepID=A0A1D6EEY6_MAIZE|nr:ABC transporter C family member 4 [Zea mays]ONM18776.1 ABC transporter C family member 4 [Zea mays]PWZ38150.1 ABC transporter C family member 14 [Zea mays]|eukprot:XP_020403964.1 ABC transporter C family member 4 [Zea mays]
MEAPPSALPWWLATTACSAPPTPAASSVAGRLAFLFLSPCLQRALLAAIDLLFLVVALAVILRARLARSNDGLSLGLDHREREPLLAKPATTDQAPPPLRRSWSFQHGLALATSAVQAAAALVLLLLLALLRRSGRTTGLLAAECAFLAAHAVAHLAAAWVVAVEKNTAGTSPARLHPLHLRFFWLATAAFAALYAGCAAARYAAAEPLVPDDPLAFAWLALSLPLLYFSATGSTGLVVDSNGGGRAAAATEETYATASWFSLATFGWINPLIAKGSRATLAADQVPPVAPPDTAEAAYVLFTSNWPAPAPGSSKAQRPVLTALLRSFWPQFLLTAVLGVAHLSVMYIGPSLVDRFVEFVRRGGEFTEGLQLVAVLLVGKAAETLASHHYEFQGQKLGMRINAALLAAVYRKSLRLSTGARRAHGAGAIVNYMEVDAQEVADVTHQLHNLWLMPLEIAVALALLYTHLGPAVLTAVAAIAVVTVVVAFANKLNIEYQFKFLAKRDERMKAITELLNYIGVIKLQAWEETFGNKIRKLREEELGWLAKSMYFMCANTVVLWSGPLAMTVLVFGTCVLTGIQLDAGKVFTATAFFRMLDGPMQSFPEAIAAVTQATVSVGRLDRYLLDAELDDSAVEQVDGTGIDTSAVVVEVCDGVFAWDMRGNKQRKESEDGESEEEKDVEGTPVLETVLKGINVEVRKGELVAVVGMVGSGKSSLLSCIMGEMEKISGTVRVCGSTAYVSQTAWIQNGTIQENILFGQPMYAERYKEVIHSCCLEKDFEMMEFGDQTEIGERGINLSGGQKQRIQLARAVYQHCDIYLLDDVFSAVDAHTGSNIFKECLRGTLKGKTVILVTHQMDFLHNVENIFVMRDGMIAQSGKYDELIEADSDFADLVAAHDSSMELVEQRCQVEKPEHFQPTTVVRIPSLRSRSIGKGEKVVVAPEIEAATSKIIKEEERESGQVSWRVYKLYMTEAWGWWGVMGMVSFAVVWQCSDMASDYWLSYETSGGIQFNPSLFIGVYVAIAAFSMVLQVIKTLLETVLGLQTAQIFFEKMFDSILHAPMSFFDTTPSGRILSRASSDQTTIDVVLAFFIGLTISMYISVLSTIIVTCQVAWPSVVAVIPLLLLNIWYRNLYLATSRELTRLEGVTKAPVIDHLSETVLGVTTIRCFKKEKEFFHENLDKINSSLRMYFHNYAANEWLGFRLELIGTLLLSITAFLMISLPSNFIKKEFVGMSLSYGLSLNSLVYFAISISCMLENDMVAVERVNQFSILPSEAAWKIEEHLPSSNWPNHGDIDIKDIKVRYRSNTPLILKGINISISGGEKIGVVGRTGSGKSTLIQALFRLVEPAEGKMIIDGIDICTLGLHDLRSRFGIIPQEPVLFEGTIRSNIDPIGQFSDAEIWQALERCQLKDVVVSKPEKLDAPVADRGENWSVGQRQLLCLGRVILKQTQILFMDEATASVDSQTDATIQKITRQEFSSCTIISIAHRIPTVMDCDRVLVLDAGLVKEFDSPSRLIEQPSLFGAMVQEYANRSSNL